MATIVGYLQLPICHTETLSAMFATTNTKTKDNYKDTDNYKDKDKVYQCLIFLSPAVGGLIAQDHTTYDVGEKLRPDDYK